MQLQIVIPVKWKTFPSALAAVAAPVIALGVMWFVVGWFGALVLAALLLVLGRLLLRAARGQ